MAVALETVVKQLTDSGIIAPGKLENFVPPKAHPQSVEELLRVLFKQNLLTKFQAQQVAAGKAKALILGGYTLLDKIGAGGMGQVFKAQHRRMERIVAIKMLPPSVTKDPATVARFEREAKAAARLLHSNIVTAFDADHANGSHFLVMEYVEGQDLSALVKQHGPLSVQKSVHYVLQAARGLEFAHAEGIIHRDIKPANLLLDKKGAVKILDMGLARIETDGNTATQAELTGTGAVMGTVDYMAPEQARSTHHADARADIYSLGCSLYYLLTARPLFEGDTITNKLISHQFDPIPSFGKTRDDVPEEIETVFRKMVAKKLDDRYQSMTAVIADLETFGSGQSTAVGIQQTAGANLNNRSSTFLKDAPAATTHPPKPTRKVVQPAGGGSKNKPPRSNKPLWIGAGGAGFLAMLLGVIVIFKNQKGEEVGRIELPPGHTAELQDAATKPAIAPQAADKVVAGKPITTFNDPSFQQWMKEVAALPAEKQLEAVAKKLQELNPGFDGKLTGQNKNAPPTIENGAVTGLGLVTDNVLDISPVRALASLKGLSCQGSAGGKGRLADISPLQGLPLQNLSCYSTRISDLSPLKGMPLAYLDCGGTLVSDLLPLAGMKLTFLDCHITKVSDLSPLRGMPLISLFCGGTQISDLSPLRRMPLTMLDCSGAKASDLSPLADCKSLNTLRIQGTKVTASAVATLQQALPKCKIEWDGMGPPAISGQSITTFNAPSFQQWMKDVAPLSAEEQVAAVAKKLQELNPGYDGKETHRIDKGEVVELSFLTDHVADISPVRILAGLRTLNPTGSSKGKGRLSDLSPLQGMSLTRLTLNSTQVIDLSPLVGMPLTTLNCIDTQISDLTPLRGMPLTGLGLNFSEQVSDLTPLQGLPLTSLNVSHARKLSDLSPLAGMKLTFLDCNGTKVSDLSPLQGMPLGILQCYGTPLSDLTPLLNMSTLVNLDLHGSKVTEESVAALKNALPNCKIQWPNAGQFYQNSASAVTPAKP